MTYDGPGESELANVAALNVEFLQLMQTEDDDFGLATAERERLRSLTRRQREWLAAAPFLLLSLDESNSELWHRVLTDDTVDLFSEQSPQSDAVADLVTTAGGFLWQLANRSRYSARLLSGASKRWCDDVIACTYFDFSTRIRRHNGLLLARGAANADLWSKLLAQGIDSRRAARDAAHLTALHMVLTGTAQHRQRRWPLAACPTAAPQLSVADGDRDE